MSLNEKEVLPYVSDTKRTSGAVMSFNKVLTEKQLDTLQWAKEFMDKYEKRKNRKN